MLQSAVPAGAFVLPGIVRPRVLIIAGLLFMAGAAIRAATAVQGGLWADEAFFLSIVNTPAWTTMLAFLAEHESHPPLFYMIMKSWVSIAGDSDAATRLLAVLIGSAVIPVVYFIGERLFSVRAGLLAAFLCTVSPSLSEHGAQLRPYGLLPLAALSSSYFLVRVIDDDSVRLRMLYVITTLAMIYTHHWGWIIVAGQQVAWAYVLLRSDDIKVLSRRWLFVSVGVAIGYLPWITAMIRQSMHAGHGGIPVESVGDAGMLMMFGAFTFFSTLFPGRFWSQETVAGVSVVVAAAVAVWIHASRRKEEKGFAGQDARSDVASPVFIAICGGAAVAAVALSPFSNLLWARCVVSLVPLLALLFGHWCVRAWSGGSVRMAVAGGMLCSVILVNAAFDLYVLTTTPRSNAREVARLVARHSMPTDLVIVAPLWYEPSFARYFDAPVQRIEFPASRSDRLVDFSNVWTRVSAPSELERVLASADTARASGRRVWLVSSRQYLRRVSDAEVAQAMRHRHPKPIGVRAVNTIRDSLTRRFGTPDTTRRAAGPEPLYDALTAYLYTLRDSRR